MIIRLAAAALVLAAGPAILLVRGRYLRWEIEGRSMLPALHPGDWVVVEAAARRGRPFRPGDVVLVPDPRDARRVLVKRLIRLTADGDAWVEGDNPAESTDSRQFGQVRAADIVGRALFRYHPLSRIGRVR